MHKLEQSIVFHYFMWMESSPIEQIEKFRKIFDNFRMQYYIFSKENLKFIIIPNQMIGPLIN